MTSLGRSFGVAFVSVATIGLALAVLGAFFAVVSHFGNLTETLGQSVELTAYLKPPGPEDAPTSVDSEELAETLTKWPRIKQARFVSPQTAFEEFQAQLGEDALILEGLPDDILPAAIEITLVDDDFAIEDVRALESRLEALNLVEDVRYGSEDLNRMHAILRMLRTVTASIGLALSAAICFIVANTLKLSVFARREEFEIMQLVGATRGFVRAPILLEGAIQGLLGGLVAICLLALTEEGLRYGLRRVLALAYGPIEVQFSMGALLFYVIIAGILFGLSGSMIAVGRFLKV